ncbi:MAG: nucleotidyltransferase family protein [Planctomycetales bacterium]|nr:nucleotidyltransferase family protein [Planctomycetales bacterium]
MSHPLRTIAVVPAAGESRRMGRPKLTLPWRGATVIEAVLEAWRAGGVERVIVVLRAGDDALRALCEKRGAELVIADPPPEDMKASILCGLDFAVHHLPLADRWCWLTAPADMPTLASDVIQNMCQAWEETPDSAVVPVCDGRRGHPVLLPDRAREPLRALGDAEGLNRLFETVEVRELDAGPAALCEDVDTPADYDRLRKLAE